MAGTAERLELAPAYAEYLLDQLPDRWRHTVAVASRAGQLAVTVDPVDRWVLVAAAWLHDIGYSALARDTGFHPLDGAAFLEQNGWPDRVAGLVAYHSGADFLAGAHGLTEQLARFSHERSAVADALTYADQTTGPHGEPMAINDRRAEALARHGPGSAQIQVRCAREPFLLATGRRVEARLSVLTPGFRVRERV
jgi:putative nucleotidyltransferase with HDIG domain